MGRSKARRGRRPPERRGPDLEAIAAREQAHRDRCARKRDFDTEQEARTFALYHRTQFGDDTVPYECDLCGRWHLASRRPPPGR
jgi:hypothetical protein